MRSGANTVLILGSAPNAEVPSADHVYCANASGHYYADRLRDARHVTCVVGAHIIAATESSGADDALKKLRAYVLGAPSSERFLLDHNPWYPGWDLTSGSMDLPPGGKFTLVTAEERAILLRDTTGLALPIFSRTILEEATGLRDCLRIAKLYMKARRPDGGEREASPVLRPSTGLWAAIIAMGIHGTKAQYTISGISLFDKAQRLPHPNGTIPGGFKGFTHHLHADRAVLKALRQIYSIDVLLPRPA